MQGENITDALIWQNWQGSKVKERVDLRRVVVKDGETAASWFWWYTPHGRQQTRKVAFTLTTHCKNYFIGRGLSVPSGVCLWEFCSFFKGVLLGYQVLSCCFWFSVFSGFSLLPSAIKRKHILLCMIPSLDISCWLCLTALLWVGEPDQTMSSLISYELIRNRRKVSRRFVGAHESKYQSLRLFEYDRHTHLPEFFLHDLNSLWISVHSIYVQGVSSDISN